MSNPESFARVSKDKVLSVCNRANYLTLVAICVTNTVDVLVKEYEHEKTLSRWGRFWRGCGHRKAKTSDFVTWLKVVIKDYDDAGDVFQSYRSTLNNCRDGNTYRGFIAEMMNAAENTVDVVLMCNTDLQSFFLIQEKMKKPATNFILDNHPEVKELITKYIS
jgi:hypothetical protein